MAIFVKIVSYSWLFIHDKMQYKETFEYVCGEICMTLKRNLVKVEVAGNAKVCSKERRTNVKMNVYNDISETYTVNTNVCRTFSQYDVTAVYKHLGPDCPFLIIQFTVIKRSKCRLQSLTVDSNVLHYNGSSAPCEIFSSIGDVPFIFINMD